MTTAPFFSVVIPTYNRGCELDRALDSLAGQSCQDFEVLVCDDGSTDDTREVCTKWATRLQLSHLYQENSGGPAGPRNNGLRHARGEWVCFLDSDDWWYPAKLERVRELAERADVIYHACHAWYGSAGRKKVIRGRRLGSPVFQDMMLGWNPLVTSTTCVRKSILEQSGGFDQNRELVAVEDFDLWLRIARITERFSYLPEALGVYVVDQGSISHYSEASLARELAVFEKHVAFLPRESRNAARKMMLYRQGLILWHLGNGSRSREMFRQALFPKRWRHRLLIIPWIIAGLFSGRR